MTDWTPEAIRALMGERTQAEFARDLGVARCTVNRWLVGRHPPCGLAARLLDEAAKARPNRGG